MTAMRRTSVIGLSLLLAAATAAADTVVTAKEVISCRVVSAGADSVRLTLAQGQSKTLPTWDVYEVRLSDTARVAELTLLLPRAKVTLDSGQPVPRPEVRTREAMRLRLDRAREARANGLPWHADIVDTLDRRTTLGEMAARCREMDAVMSQWGRRDETAAELLREVRREESALRGNGPLVGTFMSSSTCGGLLGGLAGGIIGWAIDPPVYDLFGGEQSCGGCPAGAAVGCIAGPVIGAAIGATQLVGVIARHRNRVNDLIRKVNHILSTAP